MDEQLERVARAICTSNGDNPDGSSGSRGVILSDDGYWRVYLPDARIAIDAAQESWRDISTAPKDGTPVLLWIGIRLVEGVWDPHGWDPITPDTEGTWAMRWAEIDSYGAGTCTPTHWMPLPKPPPVHTSITIIGATFCNTQNTLFLKNSR